MSCERMQSRILAYVDGRLKDSERAEMDKHLATCAACSVRVHEFRSVSDLLGELPMIEPSPAFDVRVRARAAAEPVKQSWWAWMRPSPRIAFAASMLLGAILFVGYTNEPVAPLPIPADQVDAWIDQGSPAIEDHDTLANFEPLNELPAPVDADDSDAQL